VGWVSEESGAGTAGFCGPCVCLGVFLLFSVECCVRDFRGLGLCEVPTVDWSTCDECEGGRGSLVRGWRRMEGEGVGRV
jgi:hypothetical protein